MKVSETWASEKVRIGECSQRQRDPLRRNRDRILPRRMTIKQEAPRCETFFSYQIATVGKCTLEGGLGAANGTRVPAASLLAAGQVGKSCHLCDRKSLLDVRAGSTAR